MTLTFDLKGQGHIMFPMVDQVGVHVKINFLQKNSLQGIMI